jgi:membrane protease YdiL (CAAX protease family)
MPDSPALVVRDEPRNAEQDARAGMRHLRWLELGLVLLVAFGGYFLSSFYILENGAGTGPPISNARWATDSLHKVTALLLLIYVLSRRSLRLRDLGLRWSLKDVGTGLLISGVSFVAYTLGWTVVQLVHHRMFGFWAQAPDVRGLFANRSVQAIASFLLNPFFEELIVRAYLMTEVLDLTGSSTLAVALSVAVQFSYHLYQGWAVAISLSLQFLVFALYYALSRRALPIIVAHALFDIGTLARLW